MHRSALRSRHSAPQRPTPREKRALQVELARCAFSLLQANREREAVELFGTIRAAGAVADGPPYPGLEATAAHLRLRLVPERQLRGSGVKYVARELAPGLHQALAFDAPDLVVFVHPRDVARWGRSEDELFELARRNTEAEPPPEAFEVKTPGPVPVVAFLGDSAFTTSHVLFLERYLGPATLGHLVALPDRHALLALPLGEPRALEALASLVMMARGRYASEPGQITDQLYWRRPSGTLVPVTLTQGDGGWRAAPPELDEALGRLASAR